MPAGRPSKYEPRFIDEVDKYLATTGKENQHLPKLESFATWIDVSVDALADWEKLHPEFSGALEKIKRLQKEQLIDDGIYGGKEVNATIVKLLLQNNHGMREKVDNNLSGNVAVNFHSSLKQDSQE